MSCTFESINNRSNICKKLINDENMKYYNNFSIWVLNEKKLNINKLIKSISVEINGNKWKKC